MDANISIIILLYGLFSTSVYYFWYKFRTWNINLYSSKITS